MDLNRTLENARVLGVCAWLANQTKIDVKVIRIIFIVVALVGFGSPILLYFILYLIKTLFF